jgi:pyruvate formate lyase activating enzyme
MEICGLQKVTLLDFPDRVACTVFTGGCNFRCPFCHNKLLVEQEEILPIMEWREFFDFLKKRRSVLEGVCITGGEPLMQKDLEWALEEIKGLGYLIKLDTNGSYVNSLKNLIFGGLVDYVAMDIKNSRERYLETIGLGVYSTRDVEESVEFLLSGEVDYEFRTTVVREFHGAREFESIRRWISNPKRYYLQGFQASENVMVRGLTGYGREDMEGFAEILRKNMNFVEIRGI